MSNNNKPDELSYQLIVPSHNFSLTSTFKSKQLKRNSFKILPFKIDLPKFVMNYF